MKFLSLCLVSVAVSASLFAMYDNDPTLFDRARCLTTKSALQYVAELYALRGGFRLTEEMKANLLKDAQYAIEHPVGGLLAYKGQFCEYYDKVAISKPAFSETGRFIAFPTSPNRIELLDTQITEQGNYGSLAASHVAFMGQKLVVTSTVAGTDQLVIIDALTDGGLNKAGNKIEFKNIPLVPDVCALDVSHDGIVATAHHFGVVDKRSMSGAIVYDLEKGASIRVHPGVGKVVKDGLKWLPKHNLLAMMLDNNTITVYEPRTAAPAFTVPCVCADHKFDSNGNGEYLLASNKEAKNLMLYDIGQRKVMHLGVISSDPGIITNLHNDYFIVSGCSEVCGSYLAVINTQRVIDAQRQGTPCRIAALKHLVTDKANLRDLIVCKKTGKLLSHYATDKQSRLCYGTHDRLYGTNLTDPKPHHVACLYAVQAVANEEDLALLGNAAYKDAVQDTAAKDSLFAQVVKTYANINC